MYIDGETYYPVLLRKTQDYEKESQHQHNCVRTYVERPDSIIFSIRKGSIDGQERITVEYQFRKNEILNVQERARFNELPNETFSHVANIQLANINLEYKLGTLKLPKLIKRYRNGKVTEQFSTFEIADLDDGPRVFLMTPRWDNDTPELDAWRLALQQEAIPVNDWGELNYLDELP